MRSIDIHAHLTPQCFWRATEGGGDWHSLKRERDAKGAEVLVAGDRRGHLPPRSSWTPEQRIADMDSLGVDIHVVSPFAGFYNYELDTSIAIATAVETNDEISQMAKTWPDRFAGLATIPMQDPKAAVAELERVMVQLGERRRCRSRGTLPLLWAAGTAGHRWAAGAGLQRLHTDVQLVR